MSLKRQIACCIPNLLFSLLPALALPHSPPLLSFSCSLLFIQCHHFPFNKSHDVLPNFFPVSGVANTPSCTYVSGRVVHILGYLESWTFLAMIFTFFWPGSLKPVFWIVSLVTKTPARISLCSRH